MKTISNLKKIAKSKGWQLKKIANECQVSRITLWRLAKNDGLQSVAFGVAIRVAKLLGVAVDALYEIDDEKDFRYMWE